MKSHPKDDIILETNLVARILFTNNIIHRFVAWGGNCSYDDIMLIPLDRLLAHTIKAIMHKKTSRTKINVICLSCDVDGRYQYVSRSSILFCRYSCIDFLHSLRVAMEAQSNGDPLNAMSQFMDIVTTFKCKACDFVCYNQDDLVEHVKDVHLPQQQITQQARPNQAGFKNCNLNLHCVSIKNISVIGIFLKFNGKIFSDAFWPVSSFTERSIPYSCYTTVRSFSSIKSE